MQTSVVVRPNEMQTSKDEDVVLETTDPDEQTVPMDIDQEPEKLFTDEQYGLLVSMAEAFVKDDVNKDKTAAYVNQVKMNDKACSTSLAEDLIYLKIQGPNKTELKALVDCGATVSGIAEHCKTGLEWMSKHECKSRKGERLVTYANAQRSKTGRTYEDVKLTVAKTDVSVILPTMYEMPLPKGIDMILGLDWFRITNPIIDWTTGTVNLGTEKVNGYIEVVRLGEIGKISQKAMRRVASKSKESITCFHVTCMDDEGSCGRFAQNYEKNNVVAATLTRQRLEAILQNKQGQTSDTEVAPVTTTDDLLYEGVKKTHNKEMDQLLRQYQDIIKTDMSADDIRKMNDNPLRRSVMEMAINLVPEYGKIPYRPYRRLSPREEEECITVVNKYLDDGIIQPSNSPFGAAVLFAPKKCGKLRFCVDWRPLNAITEKNSAHVVDTHDCIDKLSGSKVWSTLDAAQGYHQIPIKEGDKGKTAFNTRHGHYEFNQMSFGLANAPAVYVQIFNRIFSGEAYRAGEATASQPKETLQERKRRIDKDPKADDLALNLFEICMQIYVDDIIVFSKTEEEHVRHLELVLQRLREYHIILLAQKCAFMLDKVTYLGHEITPEGIKPLDDKIQIVKDWPVPSSMTEIRQFLGLSGYYRKFIKGHSQIAKPLTDLTKKEAANDDGTLKEFPTEAREAFDILKERLSTAPVLKIPDVRSGGFHIQCDASEKGLGAVLYQKDETDGKMHPCAFASRVLTPQERKDYTSHKRRIYELELSALIFALDKWKMMLEGQAETTVDTDHKSLIWLQSQKELTPSQAMFLDCLSRYSLDIKYIKGEDNIPADALSRHPGFADELEKREKGKTDQTVVCTNSSEISFTFLRELYQRVHDGYQNDDDWKDRVEKAPYIQVEHYDIKLWYKTFKKNEKPPVLCIPSDKALIAQIFKENHEPPFVGHRMFKETLKRIQRNFYWFKMDTQIKNVCKSCNQCLRSKNYTGKPAGKMISKPDVIDRPWMSVSMDYCGPYHVDKRKTAKYVSEDESKVNQVLVVVCRLTKMAHFIPCKTTDTAEEAATLFIQEVVRLHGIADEYRSDRDKLFKSEFWKAVWKQLGTTIAMSTAHHHQTAANAERTIQELRKYLSIYAKEHNDWVRHLPLLEMAFNSSINSSTGLTPFELNTGSNPKMPIDLVSLPPHMNNKGRAWLNQLTENVADAKEAIVRAHTEMKLHYDKRHRTTSDKDGNPVFAKKGDFVLIRTADLKNVATLGRDVEEGLTGAIEPKWLPVYIGPFEVIEVCGNEDLNRKLKLSTQLYDRLQYDEFHVSQLKELVQRKNAVDLAETLPPPSLTKDDNEEYYIEKILGHCDIGKKGRIFKVKGHGYNDPSDHWWVPEDDMKHAESKVKEYFKDVANVRVINWTRQQAAAQSTKRKKQAKNLLLVCTAWAE